MKKEILIEVFKNKACSEEVTPNDYGSGAFSFWLNKDGAIIGQLVDIRIFKTLFKFFIRYESVSFEISEAEFNELSLIYNKKKEEYDRIQTEKEKVRYNINLEDLLEIYKGVVVNERKVLIEKNG